MKQKIILVPLDDRPCNAKYPHLIGLPSSLLSSPSNDLLGYKKRPGDFDTLKKWLLKEVKHASHLVLSIDQLVYGGLIPSRLHYLSKNELLNRLSFVKELKEMNPHLKILAFVMIMRNPFYNSADEEPDYYEYDGSNIYKSGYYSHKKELEGTLSSEEESDFKEALKKLKQENLKDYLSRRALNIEIVKATIDLKEEGIIDYLVIPQDDSSPYGYTKLDQNHVKAYIETKYATNIDIYPGADEVGLSLIARAAQDIKKHHFKVKPVFATEQGQHEIPPFEDRPLIQSVRSQIKASGALLAEEDDKDAIKLYIHVASKFVDPGDPLYHQAFFVDRKLDVFVNDIKLSMENGDKVALADVAFANGGDKDLLALLDKENLALKLSAYGAWNTSSNTLGTVIAQAIIYNLFRLEDKQNYFLLHRFYEDVGYMNHVRRYVVDNELPALGLNYFDAGAIRGAVSTLVANHIFNFMKDNYPNLSKCVELVDVNHPWARMFEIDLNLSLKGATKVAVDIGGTYIKGGRVKDGKMLAFIKEPTHGRVGRDAIVSSLNKVINALLNDNVTGISISSAGDIDPIQGLCTYASDNLKGWTGFHIKDFIEHKYHLLTYVDNDAYCHINGEKEFYKNKGNITLLTFGTGVGGASIINGKLDRSQKTKWGYRVIVPNGKAQRGIPDRGASEAYLALRNLIKAIKPYQDVYNLEKLFADYVLDEPFAVQVLGNYAVYLNKLLKLINDEIHPDVIILGGGLVSNQAAIKKMIDPTIKNYAFAKLGNDAGVVGAYYLPIKEN